ncbi:hypothetical protein [Robiginitomaculum antarcticum]|uniref:hypothetical protein n=1 Tax=Robiginitomaculum antarcticum TaxID=437507 RepID=UPI000367D2DB|nr:hypothetical protein [Robiginitomaculum antarcticum]
MAAALKRSVPAIFVWAVMMVAGSIKSAPILLQGGLPGNDDYMRLAVVRDWLGGQSFWDMNQYRLFPPDPLQSHWSRIPDIFIGGLIKLFTPIFGAPGAELAAVVIYPAILLLIMLLLVTAIARHLSKSEWMPLSAALMAGMCFPLFNQFMPGRIDHHGLQIILALGAALSLIVSSTRPRFAALSGALCAISLSLGIEALPYVIALCGAVGMNWAMGEDRNGRAMSLFGGAMLAGIAVCLALSRPASLWFAPVCDALSSVYLLLGAAIAMAMFGCSLFSNRVIGFAKRLGTVSAAGLAALVVTIAVFPQCLGGPYAELDPLLQSVWLSNVAEAMPFLTYAPTDLVTASALIILPILALLSLKFRPDDTKPPRSIISSPAERLLWIVVIITFLAGLIQLRLMTFVGAFAAPLAALAMCWAVGKADHITGDIKRAFVRVGAIFLFSPIFIPLILTAVAPSNITDDSQKQIEISDATSANPVPSSLLTCQSPLWLKKLNALPAGFALTQIDLGAPMLVATHHSVSSAPYHRNEAGNLAALKVFAGSPDNARTLVTNIGADYIIACKEFPETRMIRQIAPNGLLSQIEAGNIPDWLIRVDMGKDYPMRVYRISN